MRNELVRSIGSTCRRRSRPTDVSASARALDGRKAGVYSFSVRRIWATLLVAVFSFALIGPATFVPTGDQKLPPCCRKTGKHHCALAQNHESTSGPSFQSGRCTFFPNEQTLPPIPTDGMVKVGQVILALVFSHPTPQPRTERLGGILFDRTGQKRGPPSIS